MLLQTNIFPLVGEAFNAGSLMMPVDVSEPAGMLEHTWSSWPLNSWLIIISALLIAFNLVNFYRIGAHIVKGMTRWRWNNSIEASIQISRTRDTLALLMVIPACLVIGRYGIFSADAMQLCPEAWRTAAVLGVFFSWLILRFLISRTFAARLRSSGAFETAYKYDRTFFISLVIVNLAAVGICGVFGASDSVVRTCMELVSGIMYIAFIFNKGEILSSTFHPFTTFLYLCTLEFLPLGLLIAANVWL